jgi:branched-chain amino acid transport system permease protein
MSTNAKTNSVQQVKVYHKRLALCVAALLAVFLLIPVFVKSPYAINIFVLVFYMSTLSMAWNLLGGMTGQNSLGHAAYMGLGAYACCMLVNKAGANPWLASLFGMAVVGLVAGIVFYPCFILRGPYFTLVSIAFGEALRQFIINSEFFGRASGIGLPFGADSWAEFRFASKVPYYYVGLAMVVLVYILMKKIDRSKMGYALKTIREDEDAAAAMGINPTKYKVIACVISAMVAALVGFFYVSYVRYIDPDMMQQAKSTESVLPAVVGGAAYVEGPLVGGLIMIPLSQLLRAKFSAVLPGIDMLMCAIVLILIIRVRPSGILGWYMHSKAKQWVDTVLLHKPDAAVLEEAAVIKYDETKKGGGR